MKRNKRKGATLAEICIVMAVVAIVSLSVTSFATMASGRGTAAATKLDAMGDLEIVEAVVESWIMEAAKQSESAIKITDMESTIRINETDLIRVRSSGWMEVSFPGEENEEGEILNYHLKSVTGLKFFRGVLDDQGRLDWDDMPENGVKDILYYCTVTYEYRNGLVTKEQTYTFCINPRVGEVVG